MLGATRIGKHPIHPMLVAVPIGLWVFSFLSDLVYLAGGAPVWNAMAFYTMAGGIDPAATDTAMREREVTPQERVA